MFFFTGEFTHQLDAKNRIRIPARLKKQLGESAYYFAKGTNGCLYVFPEESMQELIQKANAIALSDASKQKGLRNFFKSISLAEEDNQGRVIIPASLRQTAKIDKDIMICGVGSRMEIWAKEVYDEYFNSEDDYDDNFNLLGL